MDRIVHWLAEGVQQKSLAEVESCFLLEAAAAVREMDTMLCCKYAHRDEREITSLIQGNPIRILQWRT